MGMANKSRKRSVKANYFNTINSPEKAYVFGYLWADGSIHRDFYIKASCKNGDESILLFCKKEMGGRVWHRERVDARFKKKNYLVWEYQNNSADLVKSLKKAGFRKSALKVPVEYRNFFVRGFLDGDGCIYRNRKHYLFQLTFSYGAKNWKWLLELLPKKFSDTVQYNQGKLQARWGGKTAKGFLDWIYASKPNLGLKRKRMVYEEEKCR